MSFAPQWDGFLNEAIAVLTELGYPPPQSKQILIDRYGESPRPKLTEADLVDLACDFWGELYPRIAPSQNAC